MKILFRSPQEKAVVVISALSTVTLICAAFFLVARRPNLGPEMKRLKLMSVHDRVIDVVTSWATAPSHPADTMQLEVVWSTSRHDLPFYPEAAQLLEQQMKDEFRDSKNAVMHYRDLKDPTQNPGGSVSTVADLVRLVRANYEPQ